MAKANLEGVPETGTKWDLGGINVTVTGFQGKGLGGYVKWETYGGVSDQTKLSEWRKYAKAA